MEFFRLERLKATLVRGPLPARDTAQYLAAQGALLSLFFIPTPADAFTDWMMLASPALAVLGVYYCYRRHGGASGDRFAERYLAIGWVVCFRVLVVLVPLVVFGMMGYFFAQAGNESSADSAVVNHAIDVGVLAVTAILYWRMGVHLAAVRQASSDGYDRG